MSDPAIHAPRIKLHDTSHMGYCDRFPSLQLLGYWSQWITSWNYLHPIGMMPSTSVDRFTKMAHFCTTNSNITVEGTANFYLKHVLKTHGLPDDIVSDRGPQFTAKFTKRLLALCEIKTTNQLLTTPNSTDKLSVSTIP